MPKKLSEMTVKELRAEATRLKIEGRSSLTTKEMLVKAVSKAKAKKATSKTTAKKTKSPAKKSPAKKAMSPAKKATSKTTAKKTTPTPNIYHVIKDLPHLTYSELSRMKVGDVLVAAMIDTNDLKRVAELRDSPEVGTLKSFLMKYKVKLVKVRQSGGTAIFTSNKYDHELPFSASDMRFLKPLVEWSKIPYMKVKHQLV